MTVDGRDTGELCPTERLGVQLGTHTVEVFDPITETTKTFTVDVKDTHSSVRVKIEEE